MTIDRKVRRSQTVTPFGVGAIYDFGSESFVAMDISKWRVGREPDVRLPRLEQVLGVRKFKAAPVVSRPAFPGAVSDGKSVPYVRFPSWLFCPSCRRMFRWGYKLEKKGAHPECPECSKTSRLAPMRFMAVCGNGHLMDIDWARWAHSKPGGLGSACRKAELYFRSDPSKGAGTQSLIVSCVCGAERDLEGLQFKDSLKGFQRCVGRHPWQTVEFAAECDQAPQVVQRGGSNAYFSQTASAIDISVGENGHTSICDQIRLHEKWQPLVDLRPNLNSADDPIARVFIDPIVGDEKMLALGVTAQIVWDCLAKGEDREEEIPQKLGDAEDLLKDEWRAFMEPPVSDPEDTFIAELVDLDRYGAEFPEREQPIWREFRTLFSTVTLAKKLRIVTALTGFSRLEHSYERRMTPSLGMSTSWLPANEIFGEGIFLALDTVALDSWEKRLPIRLLKNMKKARKDSTLGFLPEVSARFVLLHTFAHILIRQLCFESGYSSSSLTERIYSDDESRMAGLLIYTASADSEGALGGLVEQGQPERLFSTIKTALFRSTWCSNDPICRELPRQGVQGLNKAACHACTLIAETACSHANSLLDRTMLIGDLSNPSLGYFSKMIELTEKSI